MERLTERLRTGEVLMASDYEEKYTEHEWISVLQDRLAAYEDTGLTPRDIKELLDVAGSKTNKVLRLKEELHTLGGTLPQIAFIVLKLCGVINWSWLWVLLPMWIGFALWLLAVVIFSIVKAKEWRDDE